MGEPDWPRHAQMVAGQLERRGGVSPACSMPCDTCRDTCSCRRIAGECLRGSRARSNGRPPRPQFGDRSAAPVGDRARALRCGSAIRQRSSPSWPRSLPSSAGGAWARAANRLSAAPTHGHRGDGTSATRRAPHGGASSSAGVPITASLKAQLAEARGSCPVGSHEHQHLLVIERASDTFVEVRGEACVFVPLIGCEGWHAR